MSVAVMVALCAGAAAQEEVTSAAGVKLALEAVAGKFIGACFGNGSPVTLPVRIVVAQMDPGASKKFSGNDIETITGWVEEAMQSESSLGLVKLVPGRQRHQIREMLKELGGAALPPSSRQFDGVIGITAVGGARTVSVTAWAPPRDVAGELCQGASRSITFGAIAIPTPDSPVALFEHAVRKLPGDVARLVVMPPELLGIVDDDAAARIMGQRLQGSLISAAGEAFQRPDLSAARRPVIETFRDGTDLTGAWRAVLRVSRSPQQGLIDVIFRFEGPQGEGVYDSGMLALDLFLPPSGSPEVTAETERVCRGLEQALDRENAADRLNALAESNQCPRLHDAIAGKAQRICRQERTHWNDAVAVSLEVMKETLGQISCREVRDDARAHVHDIEALMTSAADLGVLVPGATREAKQEVPGVGADILKFATQADDTVRIWGNDAAAGREVEVRDPSWKLLARRGGAREIEVSLKQGTYYVVVLPAPGKPVPPYTLFAVQGFPDTAGDTPATARDLGSFGIGAWTIREHVGGADKGDFFRFVPQVRSLLTLTLAGLTSEVRVGVGPGSEVVWSEAFGPGRQHSLERVVEAGETVYIGIVPGGEVATPYALGIALSKVVAAISTPDPAAAGASAPHPTKDLAVDLQIGAAPHAGRLAPGGDDYWVRFRLSQETRVQVILSGAPPASLRLSLENDGGALPFPAIGGVVEMRLVPGWYWVHVSRAGATGVVPFNLSLRRAAS